jgi:hypothetical protein
VLAIFPDYNYDSFRCLGNPTSILGLVSFSLSLSVALAVPVVAVDLDTQNLLSGISPKGLGVVPRISGVGERVVGDVIVVRVEGVGSSPRVACPTLESRQQEHTAECNDDSPPVVSEVCIDNQVGTSKRAVFEVGGLAGSIRISW